MTELSKCKQESLINSGGMVRIYHTILQKLAQKGAKEKKIADGQAYLSPRIKQGVFEEVSWKPKIRSGILIQWDYQEYPCYNPERE